MKDLFEYVKHGSDNLIIKSCVFHYEMEFVHPFMDGNGRMGRLWQTVILLNENPVFEYLPIEHQIKIQQQKYYDALAKSDKAGNCTYFIEFMLDKIKTSLEQLITGQRNILTDEGRINYFASNYGQNEFVRKTILKYSKKYQLQPQLET